ncbi:MAG: hypothetical protein GY946_11610 [bacterium]|nr:hypothetical protein [bacterium]
MIRPLLLFCPRSIAAALVGTFLIWIAGSVASTAQIVVGPYLQDAEPVSIVVMWETASADGSPYVDYGITTALGSSVAGVSIPGGAASKIHRVSIADLVPDTSYHYQVRTDTWAGPLLHFRTPPDPIHEASFRFVAYSDTQGGTVSTKHGEVVNDGIIGFVSENFGADMSDELAFVLVPGDLVENGTVQAQWKAQFFDESQNLSQFTPYYPVSGNHERNSPHYFDYFHLPINGTPGYEEHWYYKDYSNSRIIGLDSNSAYRLQVQLDWLDGVLSDACANAQIDFVFAQLHHPFKSEMWTPGETDYTGQVVSRLEQFSTQCGKPSVHFFGHTHGYSRGQSRDHRHLWINVASGEGNLDLWGVYPNAEYPEFQRSFPEWGFSLVEVEAGESPSLRVRRISRGNVIIPRDNEVIDDLTLRVNNTPPEQPLASYPNTNAGPVDPNRAVLIGSNYSDLDGDEHLETQFQVTGTAGDYSDPVVDHWNRFENWYAPPGFNSWESVETVGGRSITWADIGGLLAANTTYHWRLRHRDKSFGWSTWSAEQIFATGAATEDRALYVRMEGVGSGQGYTHPTLADLAGHTNSTPIGTRADSVASISWDPQGQQWVYYEGGGSGAVSTYPLLRDLAKDTNSTQIGSGSATGHAVSSGPGGWYLVEGTNVRHYLSLADIATNAGFSLVGSSANPSLMDLTWNGSDWIVNLSDGRYFAYPSISDVANDLNSTYLGAGVPSPAAIAFFPSAAECNDGADNDADGSIDFGDDLSCKDSAGSTESSACSDGVDNDGDGKIDWDGGGVGAPDPQCHSAWGQTESPGCGLGAELAPLLVALFWIRRSLFRIR